ncbi:Phospholipase A2 [Holothuria leucospilota]|uniref:Phospholipase A2 n=1 Tax=Holothuria leucospilota TaxID=206669 RepID=A0A9Q1C5G9_HOLLE|nr:Phospholipase A2 [Holothuria leucospilota]
MRTLILICLVIGSGFAASLRAKRDLFQFGQMILHATSRWPLNYNGYGCWCGQGGYGPTVDETDNVVGRMISVMGGSRKVERMLSNHSNKNGVSDGDGEGEGEGKGDDGEDEDDEDDADADDNDDGDDKGSGTSCQVGLCECDRTAAHCFRDSTFNPANMNYPKFTCWALSFFTQFWE